MHSFFVYFWRSFSLEFFSGKFGGNWAKILRTTKNLPTPTPLVPWQKVNLATLLETKAMP